MSNKKNVTIPLKYLREERWDILARVIQTLFYNPETETDETPDDANNQVINKLMSLGATKSENVNNKVHISFAKIAKLGFEYLTMTWDGVNFDAYLSNDEFYISN